MKPRHISSTEGTPSSSGDVVRSRTSKACDRCRLKKSKCDGAIRCSRCQADDAICIYGDRKKPHDKVYPKGYAQILEQQQRWLVSGIQKLYRCAQTEEGWPVDPLKHDAKGQPLTHDILAALGVLDSDQKQSSEDEGRMVQQGMGRHVEECTQPSKISHSPHTCTPTQPLPTPYDPQVSSPEHQVEDLKDDPDLTFLKEQDFGIIGIDGPLHLFPKSTSDTLDGASSTADGGVEIFNTNFEMRPPVEYFVENYSISTDTWNDADGLNEPFDAGTVETWPTLTEPFLGPFYSQFFSSESFVQ